MFTIHILVVLSLKKPSPQLIIHVYPLRKVPVLERQLLQVKVEFSQV
jgi:hypothetical protein